METKLGSELEFISWIRRDGSGTVMIGGEWNKDMDIPKIDNMSYCDDEKFTISGLSLTEKTFIASGFNSFVVKLKPVSIPKCVHPFDKVKVAFGNQYYCTACENNI